jgi:hypothetical protein
MVGSKAKGEVRDMDTYCTCGGGDNDGLLDHSDTCPVKVKIVKVRK